MFKFKPGDLVRIRDDLVINGMQISGSAALIVGFENEENVPKDLHELLNREIPYIIICNEIETYVWEEEIEEMEER